MNRKQAEDIARSGKVTWGEIQDVLHRAFEAGAADERRATVNKGFTKATSYNIMCGYAKGYERERIIDSNRYGEWVGARHILVEFGKFWEGWKPEPQPKKRIPPPTHQEPHEPPF